MFTNYDAIAEGYKRAKLQPWRAVIESFTLMNLIGDLAGRSVIDLACGEGYYTRQLRRGGAGRAVGVDLSEGMIDLARREEEARPLGIEYLASDARATGFREEFDLAVAAYLLNYARSGEELTAMTRAIAQVLKPGGRFVTANSNPDLDPARPPSYREYGFEMSADEKTGEGTPYTWTFHLEGGPVCVENYHLDRATHDDALRAAGFVDIAWHQPRVAPSEDAAYWANFLAHPPLIFLECRKGGSD